MAGNRSLLAFWLGGASAPAGPTTVAGTRSLLAPWIGGASAPATPPTTAAGIRSLLAFWAGGASSGVSATPAVYGGSGVSGGPPSKRRAAAWASYTAERARRYQELYEKLLEKQVELERLQAVVEVEATTKQRRKRILQLQHAIKVLLQKLAKIEAIEAAAEEEHLILALLL